MAATSTTETWDAAWTTTMRSHRKRLTDNIFDQYPTLQMLREAGNVEIESGGKEIKEDLLYAKNAAEYFDTYDTLNTDAVDGVTAAFFPWRYVAVPITISMTEEMENRKTDAAVKLLAAKTEQSMNTIRDTVNASLYGAQSGKSILGLQDIVADAPTTGTLGGINRANETWWRNQADATSTDFNSSSAPSYAGILLLSQEYNNASEGNIQPTDIFTTLTLFTELQDILEGTGYQRLTSNRSPFDAGFPAFRKAVVKYDRDCASQHMYVLNRSTLKLKIQAGLNFSKTPFKEPFNQMAKVAFIVLGTQLTVIEPRRNSVMSVLT